MNKVIITGHPSSAYEEVEELLHICGMAYADKSVREGFTPQQITQTLCRAHGISKYGKNIEQIEVGALWHSMVLDLMLANIDKLFWGWSDPNVIYLLNFWKSIDPKIAFILVYDNPESVLTRHNITHFSGQNDIKDDLNAWNAYNLELLSFYRQNQDRCLLVHAQQVRLSAASYIQQLKVRISKNLKFPDKILWKGAEILCATPKKPPRNRKNAKQNEEFENQQTIITANTQPVPYIAGENDNPLSRYIAKALTHGNRQSAKVYKELQESANLPLVNDESIAAVDAWQVMAEQVYKTQTQTRQIESLTEQLSRAEQSAQDIVRALEDEINKAKTEYESVKNHAEFLKQEQENLQSKLNEQSKKFGEIERQKAELNQNFQQAQNSAKERAEQLKSLHDRIDEQNKKTAEIEKQKNTLNQNLQQAEKSAKEKSEQLEQFKKQLEEAKKIALEKERQAKELEAKNKELQIKPHDASLKNELEQENEMLLSQLHQVQEELERYYLENQELKKNVKPTAPKLYGAKERVKNTLEYQIGATMIEHWRSGKLTLLSAVKKVEKEWKNQKSENLPPLEKYADAEEGYKAKKHLSYRLGATWLKHGNPLTLPAAILQDIKEFKEYRANNIKVSVIIPVYNVEPYLRQCLDSVINQTLKDIEIICVDDGSTDNSLAILNEYAQKDKRFTVLRQENSGAGKARNRGLAIAKGEYLSFLDSDDFFEQTMLEEMYRKAVSMDADIVLCGGSTYDDVTKETKPAPWFLNEWHVKDLEVFSRHTLKDDIFKITQPNNWTKIYKRSFISNNNLIFQNMKTCNDIYFSYMALIFADKITYINRSFVNYRRNTKNSTTSNRGEYYNNVFSVFNKIKTDLTKIGIFDEIEKPLYERFSGHFFYEYQFVVKQDRQKLIYEVKKMFPEKYYDMFLKKCNDYDNTDNPKVSLIIPVYNVEKYLRKCLDSAINQTLKDIEIICVNDGSTDNSLKILKEYEKKDERIIVIDQKNGGLSASRNAGLDIARAAYIMFIDSDDWIEPDTLEAHYETAIKEKVDVVMGNFMPILENETDIKRYNNYVKYYSSLEKSEGRYEFAGDFKEYRSSACCKLYKKEIIDRYVLRFPVGLINEDEAWHWYYFSHVKSTYCLKKAYYNRLIRSDSIMSNREIHSVGILDMLHILEHVYNYLQKSSLYEKYREQYNEYFSRIVTSVLKRCNGNSELIAQANIKIQALRKTIPLDVVTTNKSNVLFEIKDILQNKVLSNAQFRHNLRIWENKIVVIDMLDMKIAYDIISSGDSITVKVALRKDCDMNIVNKFYPLFLKGKDKKIIFITSISNMQTSLVNFMQKEIDRVVAKGLIAKHTQSV
ncbi:MAG: glycosyltransferase [Campylobacteraceae bacterium]|jgi:glycosyltransferase involved in cell wall biosynthesis|nr:glycosyltransferase [Campylobacteraceae bacterium]